MTEILQLSLLSHGTQLVLMPCKLIDHVSVFMLSIIQYTLIVHRQTDTHAGRTANLIISSDSLCSIGGDNNNYVHFVVDPEAIVFKTDQFFVGIYSFCLTMRSLSCVGRLPRNFARWHIVCSIKNKGAEFCEASKKISGTKTCKIWLDFRRLQSLMVDISRTDEDIQSWTSTFCTVILPALCGESLMN